jgi:Uma2 family endonuclease
LAWVVQQDYSRRRPTADDVLLLVEVAERSLEYDTGEKAALYAAAGIRDYWVVDVAGKAVEVRRDPEGGRYRSLQTFRGDEPIHPLCCAELSLRPAILWAE